MGVSSDIYIMDTDGKNTKRLTNDGSVNTHPRFSPDSRLIVFESSRNGNNEIYIMETDGGNQTRLTNNNFMDSYPAFLPDGHRIAFIAHRDMGERLGIYIMDLKKQN